MFVLSERVQFTGCPLTYDVVVIGRRDEGCGLCSKRFRYCHANDFLKIYILLGSAIGPCQ